MLIDELKDERGALALHYRKGSEGEHARLVATRTLFLFPLCASRVEIGGVGVDAYTVALLQPKSSGEIVGVTAVTEWVALAPSAELVAKVSAIYEIDAGATFAGKAQLALLPRTNWLNEIVHRYVYERVTERHAGNEATAFLESEIVKEMHFRCEDHGGRMVSLFDLDEKALDGRDALVRKAMSVIEANLFGALTVGGIARPCAASESSLLRAFRAALGKTPSAYVAERRLDEAMILLKSRRYSTAQVSDLVGYEGASAFGAAFKKRFGISPGQALQGESPEVPS